MSQQGILDYLKENGPARMKDIADELGVARTNIQDGVRRLLRGGFVSIEKRLKDMPSRGCRTENYVHLNEQED